MRSTGELVGVAPPTTGVDQMQSWAGERPSIWTEFAPTGSQAGEPYVKARLRTPSSRNEREWLISADACKPATVTAVILALNEDDSAPAVRAHRHRMPDPKAFPGNVLWQGSTSIVVARRVPCRAHATLISPAATVSGSLTRTRVRARRTRSATDRPLASSALHPRHWRTEEASTIGAA